MAVVMLALNGVGLGHLIRSTVVGQALASVGERPVIFSEGRYSPGGLAQFPVLQVPSLWRAPEDVCQRVAADLYSMAAISLPAVVVEDTHPNPIHLPAGIRRVLLVRPTSFEYLVSLNEHHGQTYAACLLCDSPDSPTWPYDKAQTRRLTGWKKWRCVGPIYRTPTEDEIREVRTRHQLSEDQEVCVFTMGGGGVHVHDSNRRDIVRFLRLALDVADVVQPPGSRNRLLFVQGPYFPPRIPIPSRFEVVRDEPHMPALLKIAKGAVIRAGFNTTWECIAAGTPFIPMVGTTLAEPVPERVERLTAHGLIPASPQRFWSDGEWRAEYGRITRGIVARHSGTPDSRTLERLIVARVRAPAARRAKTRTIRRGGAKRGIPLVIRVDDVACREPTLYWLLDLLATRRLRASLELVPYLLEFGEGLLNRFDPSGTLFEVSQHGYAHIPRMADGGRRCEFFPDSTMPKAEELEVIARGRHQIETAFPRRFTGGFSPPYDALPSWLPAAWHAMGGTFISCLHTNSMPGAPLAVARAGVDVWDWTVDRALSRDWVKQKLALQYAIDGHAGIVVHPRCLRSRSDRRHFLSLLKDIEAGTVTVSLKDLALGRAGSGRSH